MPRLRKSSGETMAVCYLVCIYNFRTFESFWLVAQASLPVGFISETTSFCFGGRNARTFSARCPSLRSMPLKQATMLLPVLVDNYRRAAESVEQVIQGITGWRLSTGISIA